LGKRNVFLVIIQIQNRIKTTTTQIERENILTRNEEEKIGTYGLHDIQGM